MKEPAQNELKQVCVTFAKAEVILTVKHLCHSGHMGRDVETEWAASDNF